jgi:hypothetical protein
MLCQSCNEEKEIIEFPVRKDNSFRHRPYCKSCCNNIQRARYAHHKKNNPFLHRYTRVKNRCLGRGIPFNITPEYLEKIWTGVCPVLGIELNLVTDRIDEHAAELDRFNPELGYVKGNVHWLSRKANRLKNNSTVEILEKLLEWMKNV